MLASNPGANSATIETEISAINQAIDNEQGISTGTSAAGSSTAATPTTDGSSPPATTPPQPTQTGAPPVTPQVKTNPASAIPGQEIGQNPAIATAIAKGAEVIAPAPTTSHSNSIINTDLTPAANPTTNTAAINPSTMTTAIATVNNAPALNAGNPGLIASIVKLARQLLDAQLRLKYGPYIYTLAFGGGTAADNAANLDEWATGSKTKLLDTLVRTRGLPDNLWINIRNYAQTLPDASLHSSLYTRMVQAEVRTINLDSLALFGRDDGVGIIEAVDDVLLGALLSEQVITHVIHFLSTHGHHLGAIQKHSVQRMIAEVDVDRHEFRTTPLTAQEEKDFIDLTNFLDYGLRLYLQHYPDAKPIYGDQD